MASDCRNNVRSHRRRNGKLPYTRRMHYRFSDNLSSDDEVDAPLYKTCSGSTLDIEETHGVDANLVPLRSALPPSLAPDGKVNFDTVDCAVQGPVHIKDNQFSKTDLKDEPEFKFPFSTIDFLVTMCSIIFFFYDFVSDIMVARQYFYHERWLAFGFTAGFIAVPALLSNGQSLRWYLIDYDREKNKYKKNQAAHRTPMYVWIFRIIFTFPLMLGPVVRHTEYIYHGQKSKSKSLSYKERRHHYKQMLYEDNDAGLVRMFEAFLEAAPQLVLQLFILITEKPEHSYHMKFIRPAAMLGSWVGMSWSLVSYHRALRCMQHSEIQDKVRHLQQQPDPDKSFEMSLLSVGIYFLWRAAEVGPRLVVLSLFASQFTYFVLIIVGAHWVFMTGWLLCQKTTFYEEENRRDEIIFNVVLGYSMIFCFLNARDGHTRYRALLYYMIFYAENFLMLMMWVYATPDKSDWYYFAAVGVVPGGLILHILFQLLYYKVFHPKAEDIELCLHPTERYSCYQSVCHDLEDESQPPAFV